MSNNNPPFSIGQKVVCVYDFTFRGRRDDGLITNPKNGKVYTVRGCLYEGGYWGITVEEIVNPQLPFYFGGFSEVAFDARGFAPYNPPAEKIRYVAVSKNLREKAVEIAAIETN